MFEVGDRVECFDPPSGIPAGAQATILIVGGRMIRVHWDDAPYVCGKTSTLYARRFILVNDPW